MFWSPRKSTPKAAESVKGEEFVHDKSQQAILRQRLVLALAPRHRPPVLPTTIPIPSDIIRAIIPFCDNPTLISLSQVSALCRGLAIPLLYETTMIYTHKASVVLPPKAPQGFTGRFTRAAPSHGQFRYSKDDSAHFQYVKHLTLCCEDHRCLEAHFQLHAMPLLETVRIDAASPSVQHVNLPPGEMNNKITSVHPSTIIVRFLWNTDFPPLYGRILSAARCRRLVQVFKCWDWCYPPFVPFSQSQFQEVWPLLEEIDVVLWTETREERWTEALASVRGTSKEEGLEMSKWHRRITPQSLAMHFIRKLGQLGQEFEGRITVYGAESVDREWVMQESDLHRGMGKWLEDVVTSQSGLRVSQETMRTRMRFLPLDGWLRGDGWYGVMDESERDVRLGLGGDSSRQ
ncbi:hypothetical protein IAT38_005535 [Cryptococcus sp. DSM 104549]